MRFTEFKPILVEFANTTNTFQIKKELDSLSQAAKFLPPEADLDIKKIAFDFAKTKAKVDEFLAQLEQAGKLEKEERPDPDEEQELEDPEFSQQPENEPQPVADVPVEEPLDQEVPIEEPLDQEVPEQPTVREDIELTGDEEYNAAVEAIEKAKSEIEFVESIKMAASDKKRIIAQYQKTIDLALVIIKKYDATVQELRSERQKRKAAEDFTEEVFGLLEDLGNRVQGYTAISPEEYTALPAREKKLHDNAKNFAAVFQQALFGMVLNMLRKNQEVQRAEIVDFLQACKGGRVIDMNSLVGAKSGNVKNHVNKDYEPMLDLFAQYKVFSWSPGKTSGAIGPGEMALSMMGNPSEKAREGGDLIVGDQKIEIKAGSTKGGRLNSKKILKAPAAWNVWAEGIENIIKESDDIPKNAKWPRYNKAGKEVEVSKKDFTANTYNKTPRGAKKACVYNWNYTYLRKLNDEVLIYSDPEKTYDLFYNTISTLITNLDDVAKPAKDETGKVIKDQSGKVAYPGVNAEKLIWAAIYEDGTIDVDAMMKAYTRLAYESYNREDKVTTIMFLNTDTLDYTIVNNGPEFMDQMLGPGEATVRISGGFNFNDDQQSATPAYLAVARSPKIIQKS